MFKNVPKGKVSKTYPSSYTARILPTLAGVGNILLILFIIWIYMLLINIQLGSKQYTTGMFKDGFYH